MEPTPWHFDTRHVGRRAFAYESVASTNDVAAELASDPANDGIVVVAGFQTAGRGQYGRIWESRPGVAVLMSVLLFPPPELRRAVIMTAWAAVGVAAAIRELAGVEARIKWPNDVFISGKKVCGILIEQKTGVVAGMGLNLNQTADDFAAAGLPDATSLALVSGQPFESRAATAAVIQCLDAEYSRLVTGDLLTLETAWKRRIGLVGQLVSCDLHDGTAVVGRLRDMSFDGLEIETDSPVARVVKPEVVRHIRAV
ncbi:biotin--[acetyl-CoA-carboxylase] ligase [Fimbriiglobus ruber]|uniref:Biotin-protein ligase n=1 Tax=Fimbriiglobus ruber TaxID=1908690 RepID=A0A225DB01_9BACT|nr:biotin--[acetyl-CoA-carboxylase] ligase [Fimbriiglobus ruber]OWK34476.1 Biotin-protein ligase [Fimbriiglobus ruber]